MGHLTRAGRAACLAGFFLVILSSAAFAQCDSSNGVPTSEFRLPPALSFLAPVFFPKVFSDEGRLKDFIGSEEFRELRRARGDLEAVDRIFAEARALSWGNCTEALFITFVATMDHREFGVRLPLFGPVLWFPLTSEFADTFRARLDALPSRLYADTPGGRAGDRDKLQHFFGSAFLTVLFESADAADRVGQFIEIGEDMFVVGGVNDPRDMRANRQGQAFGTRLLAGEDACPSHFIESPGMRGDAGFSLSCAPGDSLSLFMEER